jgi:hypothetical protein
VPASTRGGSIALSSFVSNEWSSLTVRSTLRNPKGSLMRKLLLVAIAGLSLAVGAAFAKEVKDWRDLHRAHEQIQRSIHELERARAANHYDMAGHGAKAEQLLREAEHELRLAVEAAKGEK